MKRIAVIPGDGIGPEVVREAVRVLHHLQQTNGLELELVDFDWGAEKFLREGVTLPEGALEMLTADFDAVSVAVSGSQVRLTRREFELLRYLVENRNRVLSRDRLLERVWGYEQFIETRSIDVHVGRLRSKLGNAGPQIETVVGLGYRFVDAS